MFYYTSSFVVLHVNVVILAAFYFVFIVAVLTDHVVRVDKTPVVVHPINVLTVTIIYLVGLRNDLVLLYLNNRDSTFNLVVVKLDVLNRDDVRLGQDVSSSGETK